MRRGTAALWRTPLHVVLSAPELRMGTGQCISIGPSKTTTEEMLVQGLFHI